jgi:hypothetical protein
MSVLNTDITGWIHTGKSMKLIYWLIRIIPICVFACIVSGCTVIGFIKGTIADREAVEKSYVKLNSLSFDIDDIVEIQLKDGAKFHGRITEIKPSKHIKLILNKRWLYGKEKDNLDNDRLPIINNDTIKHEADWFLVMKIKWSDIEYITLYEGTVRNRIISTIIGFTIDAAILFVYAILDALSSLEGAN